MRPEHMRHCIDVCHACAQQCDECVHAYLLATDNQDAASTVVLIADCGQVCQLAASYMERGSRSAAEVCNICAAVCAACSKACAQHAADYFQQCATVCWQCADECHLTASGRQAGEEDEEEDEPTGGAYAA